MVFVREKMNYYEITKEAYAAINRLVRENKGRIKESELMHGIRRDYGLSKKSVLNMIESYIEADILIRADGYIATHGYEPKVVESGIYH
jgi:hypothetical protein